MKKLIVAILIVMAPLLSLQAQQPISQNNDPIESLKIAFLTKKLALTSDEAKQFWPVYYNYSHELKKNRKEHLGDELELREKSLNITKKYKPEFITCIGAAKFNLFLKSEGEWRQVLKDEIRRRKDRRLDPRKNRL